MFILLNKEYINTNWDTISVLLKPAVDMSHGEFTLEDIKARALSGRTAIFKDDDFVLTAEFSDYPQYRVMIICFGAGKFRHKKEAVEVLRRFALINGAKKVITYCKNPAMLRYYQRHFGFQKAYDVLETIL